MVLVSTGNSASCGKRQLEVVVMHQDHGIHRASLDDTRAAQRVVRQERLAYTDT
jgi:hypothetical protein